MPQMIEERLESITYTVASLRSRSNEASVTLGCLRHEPHKTVFRLRQEVGIMSAPE